MTGLSNYNVILLEFIPKENLILCLRGEHKMAIDVVPRPT